MKKLLKKILILAVFSMLAATIFMAPTSAAGESAGYVIDQYNVNVTVTKARTYLVTETITVTFDGPHHGIYRAITNGGTAADRAEIVMGSANTPMETEDRDGYVLVRLGNPNEYVDGTQTYRLSYRLVPPLAKQDGYDYVYLNLIGTDFATTIAKVDAIITFPDKSEPGQYDLTVGGYGSKEKTGATVSVVGNHVSLQSTRVLEPNEGITLAVNLPAGTFARSTMLWMLVAGGIVLCILALTALLYWLLGRDKPLIKTVEFYAPDGLNPTEVGYIVSNAVSNTSATALFFYWASHGHMEIVESGKSTFYFRKLSSLDSEHHKMYERQVFEAMFALGDGTVVTDADLTNHFYKEIGRISTGAVSTFGGERRLSSGKATACSVLCGLLNALAILLFPALSSLALYGSIFNGLFSVSFAWIVGVFGVLFWVSSMFLHSRWYGMNGVLKTTSAIGVAILGGAACLISIISFGAGFLPSLFLTGVPLLGIILSLFISKRTEYGQTILERTLGFADFLRTAEKDRIETLIKENPSYYYDTLPYALALGVTDVWAHKFDGLITEPPVWYTPYYHGNLFTAMYLGSMMHHSMNNITAISHTVPQSAGGGGSGFGGGGGFGGGFSGGGSGGGGGGAW